MKLLRYGPPGKEQPGMLDAQGAIRSLGGVVPDITGETLSEESLERLRGVDPASLRLVTQPVRLGPCIAHTSKVVGVAQNYSCFVSHAGLPQPIRPILFIKPPSSICGPEDNVVLAADAEKADWEIELGVVIARTAHRIQPEEVMDHVGGYCIINDITERGRFALSGQFVDGKSDDTFTPIGPYLITRDEVSDHRNLGIQFDLNGQRYQDGNTANMIFGVETLISHISHLMSLVPGDIVATGTPMGVGARSTPPRFLRDGDMMLGSIDGFGQQRTRVVSA